MRSTILNISIALTITLYTGACLFAQEDKPDVFSLSFEELAEIQVITASQKIQEIENAPANIYVISGNELYQRGYSSLFDLVADLPGMTWTSALGYLNNGTPVIRGIRDVRRLKLMINGMTIDPKNGFGTGWIARFPIEGIDRVEYIVGPYASLYGRNTFSGVINVVTKTGHQMDGGILNLVYGKYSHYQGTAIYSKKFGTHDFYFSLFKNYSYNGIDLSKEYPEYYGIENREGKIFQDQPVIFMGNISKDFLLPWNHSELYFKYQNDNGLLFDLFYNHSQYPKVGNGLTPLFYSSPREAKSADRIFNIRVEYDKRLYNNLFTKSSIVYQDFYWFGRNYYLSGLKKWYSQKSKSILLEEKARYRFNKWNELYVGVSFESVEEYPNKFTFENSKPEWTDEEIIHKRYFNLSLQNELIIFEKFRLIAGLMFEASSVSDNVLIPRLSFLWEINNNSTLKFLFGSGYLTPDPIVGVDQIIPVGATKGTSEIDPEFIDSYDLNFIHRFNKNTELNFSIYLMQVKDQISQIEDTTLSDPFSYKWVNLGRTVSKGIDLNFKWRINDNIKLFSSASYVDGFYDKINFDGSSNRINHLPVSVKFHSKIGINILLLQRKLNIYIHNLFIGNRYTFRDNKEDAYQFPTPDFKLDSYNLVDLNISTTTEFSDRYFISAGIKNLFDKKAFDILHQDGVVMIYPPIRRRYWIVQVKYKF